MRPERSSSIASIPSILSDSTLPSLTDLFPPQKPLPLRITDIFMDNALCALCARVPVDAVSLQCGHSFCTKCTREAFRAEFRTKLEDFLDDDAIKVPTSPRTQAEMVATIRKNGRDPEDIFRYQCPMCRATVNESPVPNYVLRSLVSELQRELIVFLMARGTGYRATADDYYKFEGLFL
ncbi:hypothetical protein CC2G_002910 [Coprinopsis cinerea AmutBmut pab1-1]|nr:hypothetical protein CC2G_002910 [Coprinopsis cinerea AmutBmut pab1-1]